MCTSLARGFKLITPAVFGVCAISGVFGEAEGDTRSSSCSISTGSDRGFNVFFRDFGKLLIGIMIKSFPLIQQLF